MSTVPLALKFSRVDPSIEIPRYTKPGDACMDLRAYLPAGPVTIQPGDLASIPTGLKSEFPTGYEAQVRGRSGVTKKQVFLVPMCATIDSGYRGEWLLMLHNASRQPFVVNDKDRIAQFRLAETPAFECVFVSEGDLTQTERGVGGFGHTGLK